MKTIDTVDRLSQSEFYTNYVQLKKPVLIKKMTQDWPAIKIWDMDYFRKLGKNLKITTKTADIVNGTKISSSLADYVDLLEVHEKSYEAGIATQKPPYLHDIPLFNMLPELIADLGTFPIELFPKWYHKNWNNYIQFFMGGSGSLTPLHFDTLLTNNLFFQVKGEKKFILIKESDKENCYIEGWRWSKFDPSNPDYEKFSKTKGMELYEVDLGPGDILFIPSGMLHQVHGLSYSISFNIDWHTSKTAFRGILSGFKGAPRRNVYYNLLIYLGLKMRIPSKYILPYYKSYLNYVS
ncbi:Cupin-like domain-containing protein [Pedobacter terrae]|uniref:Cupin-like domain-containing protein n=1 Tax=Pedobacter terrae TaxID=405671 RepID=A0A1G8ENW6_9SPHI|nr:cupin-like domain-containing protein [Pedobacter terrae]SDH71606.1 Cupin-like domain-containing protein [Pedobacter terrae]